MATRTNMFEVESNFGDLNLHSQVDHSFQDSNIRTSYFMENEYVPQITEDSHFQSQIEQEGPLQPLADKWGDFEDDEAYWSDDEEDEDGPCRNDDGVNVRNNGGGEEGDNKCGEEGDEILSNYESEDKEHPLLSESEDEQNPINMLNEQMRNNYYTPWSSRVDRLVVGQEFDNVQHFRRVLQDYIIKNGFDLNRIKNESNRFRAKCSNEGCPWFIYAALVESGTKFRIQKLNDVHECDGVLKTKEASYTWIASQFESTLKNNPKMPVKSMKDELVSRLGIETNKKKIYRAKKKALDKLNGNYADAYQSLRDYAQVLRERNPDVLVKMKFESGFDKNRRPILKFQRFMFSFPALKDGFIYGCRWFIGLDGCHLKGSFGGVLLSAVALDANGGIFPIAICICESECADSWKWFLAIMSEWLNIENQSQVTFMTDRQKGILKGLEVYLHGATVRHCARHIFANLRLNHPDVAYRNLFWAAARAMCEAEWKDNMEKIRIAKKDTQAAYDYLIKIDKREWARHTFVDNVKVDHVTNNMSESWNSWLNECRDKLDQCPLINNLYLSDALTGPYARKYKYIRKHICFRKPSARIR